MAMIECPECGRKISGFAPTCPGCGVPQDMIKKMLAEQGNKEESVTVQTATIETMAIDTAVSQTVEVHTLEVEKTVMQTATAQTVTVKTDTEMKPISDQRNAVKKNVIESQLAESKMVNCAFCKKSYSMAEGVCPKCKNPLMSVSKDIKTLKQLVKDYRRETETSLRINTQDMKVRQHLETGHYQGDAAIVKAVVEPKKNEVIPVATISKAGEYYKMGYYRGEEILWRVLKVEDEKALLISEKGLDVILYHDQPEQSMDAILAHGQPEQILDAILYRNQRSPVTWEYCTIRGWLNTEFMNKAFSEDEKSRIPKIKITADKNLKYDTAAGNDTEDQLFLLSIQEAEKYFTDDEDRKAYPTAYAKKNGAYVDESTKCCTWWLRSPGNSLTYSVIVASDGWIHYHGNVYNDGRVCVRPALWLKLDSNKDTEKQTTNDITEKVFSDNKLESLPEPIKKSLAKCGIIIKTVAEPAIPVEKPTKNGVIPVKKITKAGEYYKMGHYGGEEILWRVLKVEDERALLISEKGLDTIPYNNLVSDITWEHCTLRSWLNTVFLNTAFSRKERFRILRMYITADQNPEYVPIMFLEDSSPVYGAAAGNGTWDQVFLLSIQESEKYFANDEDREAYPTAYAEKNGAFIAANKRCCLWWLRSPGSRSVYAAYVSGTGTNVLWGQHVDAHDICVRPALWVNL